MEITDLPETYRVSFDESNPNWTKDRECNLMLLKSVQQYMNSLLQIRGYVFLNEVYDALKVERTYEGQLVGWLWEGTGDGFVDFAPSGPLDDGKIALEFNVDGVIIDYLARQ